MKRICFFLILFLFSCLMTACSPDEDYTAGHIELDTAEFEINNTYTQGSADIAGGLNNSLTRNVTLTRSLIVSKKEITYYEWMTIKNWGSKNLDYKFYSGGRKGSNSDDCSDEHPATMITWRDAIAWCNALSENEGLEPVYYTDSTFKRIYREPYIYEYEPSDDDYNPADDYEKNIGPECVKWDAGGYRLLTEAEWEFLARTDGVSSVSDGQYFSGYSGDPAELGIYAWYSGNTTDTYTTRPVGKKAPNKAGLYDMTGNVCEWCWDEAVSYNISTDRWYKKTFDDFMIDEYYNPVGPESYSAESEKIVRGGCFSDPEYIPSYESISKFLASSYRLSFSPVTTDNAVGFRVCRAKPD